MELYLIRHTQPDIAQGICYGQTDLGLNRDYLAALAAIKEQLRPLNISHIYTSPLVRCTRLASDVFTDKAVIEPRLMELDFGLWEMKAWSDIPQTELDAWAEQLVIFTPPGGENLLQLNQRVLAFYHDLLSANLDSVAVVCHGGVIRCLLAHLMQMPLKANLNWQIDYGSVSKLIIEEQFVRLCYTNKLN